MGELAAAVLPALAVQRGRSRRRSHAHPTFARRARGAGREQPIHRRVGRRAPNLDNQNAYAAALQTRFPRTQHPDHPPDPDTGNYYDAAYFLAYAAYAADLGEPLTGPRMAAGLERLVDTSGADLNVGPRHSRLVFDTLDRGETVALDGTLGPPDFTTATAR